MSTVSCGLAATDFSKVFPFHVVFDRDMRVLQVGDVLARLLPTLCRGQMLGDHFYICRPKVSTFSEIRDNQQQLFLLESQAEQRLLLKGQMLVREDGQSCAFLGTPCVGDVDELEALRLGLVDFPLHHDLADFLVLVQTHKTALLESNVLNQKLHLANQTLEDRVRSRTADLADANQRLSEQNKELQVAMRRLSRWQHSYKNLADSVNGVVWQADAETLQMTMFTEESRERVTFYPVLKWAEPGFLHDHLHPEDREWVMDYLEACRVKASRHDIEFRMLAADGREVWVRNVFVVGVTGGQRRFFSGMMMDVTSRKHKELELRKQSSALENAADIIAITDVHGVIEYVNAAFESNTGWTRQEAIGKTPSILRSGKQDSAFYRQMLDTIRSGQVFRGTLVNRRKDGRLYVEEKTITPLTDEKGTVTHFLSNGRDITEKQKLEDQLRQSQKMEAVGRLAGGVAHDFNNMVTVVLGYCDLLLSRPGDDESREFITEMKQAAERSVSLTRQLMAFSRQQIMQPKVLSLNQLIGSMHKMLTRLIGEDIALVTRLDAKDDKAKVDPGQIEQVLMNLVINSRDAISYGGTITIETSTLEVDNSQAHCGLAQGEYVMISVSDTGSGMDAETQSKIFEPFFTTKEVGKGTGLGLATVYGIVQHLGGVILVNSEVGVGTTFKIYFPVSHAEVTQPAVEVHHSGQHGHETILLVEDEDAVRNLAQAILVENGYSVLTARNGAEALDLCGQENHNHIHLLLTDVIMPQISGARLAEEIQQRRSDIQVIYMSGYTDDLLGQRQILDADAHFLQKPFTARGLSAKVREVLDGVRVGA